MTERPHRRALITGITGQDGSYLADELLDRGYMVTGVTRRGPDQDLGSAEHRRDEIALLQGEVTDPEVQDAIVQLAPDELYHLGAPTFVPDSWERPAVTMAAIYGSAAALLALVSRRLPESRLFVAGSAEIFGDTPEMPQSEQTACRPRSPYAIAKLAAHQLLGQLRGRDHVFAVSGILYNHESERRPERFVTRKITHGAAEIALGIRSELELGDLSATRDWSFAGDVMHGAWLSLQHSEPADYVFASGIGHTVAQLVEAAFAHVGLDPAQTVRIDESLVRAPESVPSIGDPSRARAVLGWEPTLDFAQLIGRMVDADLAALRPAAHD